MNHTATYSPEDNKLRLYPAFRLDADEYAKVKAAGFKWAGKQELFVAPTWTPAREDLLLELCDEIGDEDYSPEERAADRAERFGGYRDKRAAEAGGSADRFDAGPSVFGHQSRARAERQAARHDRFRTHAVSQWAKAEYWQWRTAGVISNALHRSSAPVRRSRILRLEAEQRKHEKDREESRKLWDAWGRVMTLEGTDRPVVHREDERFIGIDREHTSQAGLLAYSLANTSHDWGEYAHPRTGRKSSLYSHLTDPQDPITPAEAVSLWFSGRIEPGDPESNSSRWSAHYELRLTYERAMLAAEGGTAAEADMVPGGWICTGNDTRSVLTDVARGWKQIQSVTKSPKTGRVVSVKVWGTHTGDTSESNYTQRETRPALVSVNIERLPEGAYRAPTPEELHAFQAATAERKAEAKAAKPKEPSLVNPTDEDAERLQTLWNARARARHAERRAAHQTLSDFEPATVYRMTQAEYSARSKGSYARCETRTLYANGRISRRSYNMWSSEGQRYDAENTAAGWVCKIRICDHGDHRVIILTDKPQKPFPIDWANVDSAAPEAAEVTA